MDNSKIPTAEEFLNNLELEFQKSGRPFFYKDALKVFARLHVVAALNAALEDSPHGSSTDIPSYDDMKEAILNAYPLTNIK